MRLFLALVVLVCALVFTLPFWMGSALRTFAPQELVTFESYEMDGYGRFRLNGTNITHPQATISIDELNSLAPLNWLKQATLSYGDESVLSIGEIVVTLPEDPPSTPKGEPSAEPLPANVPEAIEYLESLLVKTDKWLPEAVIQKLIIIRGEKQITLGPISWEQRRLTLEGSYSDFPEHPVSLALSLPKESTKIELAVPTAAFDLTSGFENSSKEVVVNTLVIFRENTALIEATFGDSTWSPESAVWSLNSWDLNLTTLGLKSAYSQLNFDLTGNWEEGSVANVLDGRLSTDAQTPSPLLPPVDFESEIGGNTKSLSVSRFSLNAPGVNASISDPVEYDLQEMQMTGNMRFDIDLDLGILNQEDLAGRLTGLLEISTDQGNPIGQFTLSGSEVNIKTLAVEELDLRADLNWPTLQVHNVTAVLETGSSFQAQALLDLQNKTVANASLDGILNRETLAAFLPEDVSLETITFAAEASGSMQSLQHNGSLDIVSVETQVVKPLSLAASWRGQSTQLESLELDAKNEENSLSLQANGNLHPEQMQWNISQLDIASAGQPLASLAAPATLLIDKEENLHLRLGDLKLDGTSSSISIAADIDYPGSADIDIQAVQVVTSNWIDPWLKNPLPPVTINSLSTKAVWNEGPIQFEATLDSILTLNEELVQANGKLSSQGSNIQFENIEISDAQGPWVTVNGVAPIRLNLADSQKIQLQKDQPIGLSIVISESQNWLNWLSGVLPFELDQFHSQVELNGSLNNLEGTFEFGLETQANEEEHSMPPMAIQSSGEIDNTLLNVSSLSISILEEVFNISGTVQLPEQLLSLIDNPATEVPWEESAFSLVIPQSQLTPLHYFAPQLLSKGGDVEVNLSGSIADGINGFFRVTGLSTRAIFPFGSFRDLTADLEFQSSRATLNGFSGYIGREPVTVTGSLDYRNWKDPIYQFTVAGEDLPLLRKPGLLLRSDLDLTINKVSSEATTVQGLVNLKDGLFLLNKNTLLAAGSGGGRSASSRPPFFAVDVPYLADWVLDIVVKGDEFIRVNTPAADGTLSLDMKLQGKLKEPFATGRVNFDKGNLFFPFSSFKIDYGVVELPIDNPYTPMMEIMGASRRFGYDLGVEITGSAYDPKVRFTSNPPLSSEQIVLMVMTGENPEGMFDYSTTQRASKLGSFISKGLFSSGDSGGNFMSRLSVNSGENLSEQGKETMEIEFLLNERFQLRGEYDEYDFWNAGLKWRILQRHVRDEESEDSAP